MTTEFDTGAPPGGYTAPAIRLPMPTGGGYANELTRQKIMRGDDAPTAWPSYTPPSSTQGVELKRGTGDTPEEIARFRAEFDAAKGVTPPATPTAQSTVMPTHTPPAQPAGANLKDYASTNPVSQYDRDLAITNGLADAYSFVGLHKQAAGTRELHMKLQGARIGDVVEQAQRSFVAGDMTKMIDVMNHTIPDGERITGYGKNPDGSLTFRTEKGVTETRSPQQIMEMLSVMRDPKLIGTMMVNRAKGMTDAQNDIQLAREKGRMSMDQAIARGVMDTQRAMMLAEYNRTHGKGTTHVDMTGNVYIDKPDGRTVKIVEEASPLDPKRKVFREVEVSPASSGGQSVTAPAAGGGINAARIAAALGGQ